ncbi:MAG: alpha/beta fold hydrolase [Calditrichaeota bacterium]|nr:MAG: alpha/beta fold hydrolase [Calditrichota bacterium]
MKTGILLIHGFTGSPNSMAWLAEEFKRRGFTVAVPKLCGHGGQPDDLIGCTYKDWLADAEGALRQLQKTCDSIIIAGLSLGGAISIYLASKYRVNGIVTMAAPFCVSIWTRTFAWLFYPFVKYQYKDDGPDINDKSALKNMNSYNLYPTIVSHEVFKFLKIMRKVIHTINCPVLVLHGENDHVVDVENADKIMEALTTPVKMKKTFNKSYHILSLDFDKAEVRDSILNFITQNIEKVSAPTIQT